MSGDYSLIHCLLESINITLSRIGLSNKQCQYTILLIKWQLIQMLWKEAENMGSGKLNESDIFKLKYCIQQISGSITENVIPTKNSLLNSKQVKQMLESIENMDKYMNEQEIINSQKSVPVLNNRPIENLGFPLFDTFQQENVEGLAGPAELAPIFRPIEFTLVPDSISDFIQLTEAMHNADNICTLLAYQSQQIKYTHTLTVSLIQYMFTHIIPIPLPHNHPNIKQCMYRQPIRYETQLNLLRLLHHLCLHFSACSMSLRMNRAFDSSRILTMASMAAVADAVIRMRAYDIPSMLSLHLNGTAPPTPRFFFQPFGFDASVFRTQSEDLIFFTPELVTTRTRILDYFTAQREIIKDDHLIFQFEINMLPGNIVTLFEQLCWEIGFPNENLPLYVTGEQTEIIYNYPELEYYRDIVFMFKFLMTPDINALPEIKPWMQKDAKLTWNYNENEGK